jgi:hypothetical protein
MLLHRVIVSAVRARGVLLGVLAVSTIAVAACGGEPTAPRAVVTPEGALFTAGADRAEIARGETVVITLTLVNTRDTAITLPPDGDCGLAWEAVDATGRGVWTGCAVRGGAVRLGPGETLAAHVPFTGREVGEGGVVFEYPAGSYVFKGVLGQRRPHDPDEVLTTSSGAPVLLRDR